MPKKVKNQYATKFCIFYKNKSGFGGIAVNKASGLSILVDEKHENFALDKDEVEVLYKIDRNGNCSGSIIRVLKHNTTNLIGVIIQFKDKNILKVSDLKFGSYLVLIDNMPGSFKPNELFYSTITSYPTPKNPFFTAQIINSIGLLGDYQAFITEIILESNLPTHFSAESLEQAKKYKDKLLAKDIKIRNDLRQLPFVTIDGEDAKDFDDAVFCEYSNDKFILYVAIADVAHYVTHASSLDFEAYRRGTSVYFPRQVIPMLPERLSNELCSLNPDQDKLVMCCKMYIDKEGLISNYEISNAIIRSSARLTYNQVQDWINDTNNVPYALFSNLSNLYLVYKALLNARDKRGAINFESEEAHFVFDERGEVSTIESCIRSESHKLVEECMLAANVCVANFMVKHDHSCLFRVHAKPSEDKFNNLKEYLNSLAIEFNVTYEKLTPIDYANLIESIKNHPQFNTIQQLILRSMQLAVYSPNNIGHFGLNYEKYLHFTSPIRRYADLITHRALKKILNQGSYEYSEPIEQIGEQVSFTERRAEELERKVDLFYKCKYAKSHIGSHFIGNITSVANFGLFIYIPELMVDGLLHIADLGDDYFIFDEKQQALLGKKSGTQFRGGQQLTVEIVGVDMGRLFIDLMLY